MDTDCYLAMEYLKLRMEQAGKMGPGSDPKLFQSTEFKEMQEEAWRDAVKFRAIREEATKK